MEFYQLLYFKKIAESENITKTSADLNVSQPSLSRSLKNLETELGVQLFDRNGKKLLLNKNGTAFLGYVNHILDTLSEATQKMTELVSAPLTPLKIATMNDNCLMPQLISAFHRAYPHIHIQLRVFSSVNTVPADCTVALHSSEEVSSSAFKSAKLLTEECLIGLSVDHPLAKREYLTLDELTKEPFIVLSQQSSYGEFSRYFFRLLGFQPPIIMECDNQIMLDAMVAENVGLALYPSRTWAPDKERVVLKRIENHHLYQPVYISYISAIPDPSTELFWSFAISYFQ